MSPALVACVYRVMVFESFNSYFWAFHTFMLVLTLAADLSVVTSHHRSVRMNLPVEVVKLVSCQHTQWNCWTWCGNYWKMRLHYNAASFSSRIFLLNGDVCIIWIAFGWIVMTVDWNIHGLQRMNPLTFNIAIIRSKVSLNLHLRKLMTFPSAFAVLCV